MIRPYHPDDKPGLMELIWLNIPRYFAAEEAKEFENYLDEKAEDYFILEIDDILVGSGGINYFPQNKTARISWDMLHPNYQRKGYGKQLVSFRLNLIRQNLEIEQVIVRTTQLAYPFYEKSGFSLIKIEKDYWAKGFDLYEMQFQLSV